jgi:hypothetical protein
MMRFSNDLLILRSSIAQFLNQFSRPTKEVIGFAGGLLTLILLPLFGIEIGSPIGTVIGCVIGGWIGGYVRKKEKSHPDSPGYSAIFPSTG